MLRQTMYVSSTDVILNLSFKTVLFLKCDRTHHADVSEANYHSIIWENNRTWADLNQICHIKQRKWEFYIEHTVITLNEFIFITIQN